MAVVLAWITGNSFILLGVLIVLVFAVAYGLFTRLGSGIWSRPIHDQRAPGADGPGERSGVDQGEGSATGSDQAGTSDPQHGTR